MIKKLIKNITNQTVLQALIVIVPIILYPLAISEIGLNNFGKLIYARIFISLAVISANFGLQVFLNSYVSKMGYSIQSISLAFYSKVFVGIFVLFIYFFSVSVAPSDYDFKKLLYLGSISILYEILTPSWYYLSRSNLFPLVFSLFIGRLLFTLLVLVLLKTYPNIYAFELFNQIGNFLSTLLILFWSKHLFSLKVPNITSVIELIKMAFANFLNTFLVRFYLLVPRYVVQFSGNSFLAVYDVLEKVVTVGKYPQSILNTSIFPLIMERRSIRVRGIVILVALLNFCLALGIFLSHDIILTYFHLDSQYTLSLILFSLAIPIVGVSSYLSHVKLLGNQKFKENTIISFLGVIVLVLIFTLLKMLDYINLNTVIISIILMEFFVLISILYFTKDD